MTDEVFRRMSIDLDKQRERISELEAKCERYRKVIDSIKIIADGGSPELDIKAIKRIAAEALEEK